MTIEQQATDTTQNTDTQTAQNSAPPAGDAGTQAPADSQQPPAGTTQDPAQESQPDPDVPESHDGYSVEIDGFDFDDFKASNSSVLESFHAEGMTNKQVEAVVRAYHDHTAAHIEALEEEWGGNFNQNATFAKQAIQAAGLNIEDADSPAFGLRLAAYYGQKLQEDMPPPAQNTQQNTAQNIEELMRSEAYMDEKHADHAKVQAQVAKFYERMYGG
ncbi:hypothetical protein IL972_00370 [Acinetobacter sp. FL51]|uniref:hypothetical protein n=1 Tax=Acinetobacter sp. FL51 TaxID=2777978 RepID=UPI0018E1749D|nr:hypothetical protein [Acinetobacter sp. FL51]MBI1450392.1 hypothetical protein [Acinetobacter sp. FL51]